MELPEVDSIDDLIAEDHWAYRENGQQKVAHVVIGKPQPAKDDSNGDWTCPLFIEHFTDRIVPVMGVGSVDALKNALTLVAEFDRKVGPVTPRAGSK